MRTNAGVGAHEAHLVRVELWGGTGPTDLRLLHKGLLYVGRAGVELGNADNSLITAAVPPGEWSVEVWVDADAADEIHRVAFVLPSL